MRRDPFIAAGEYMLAAVYEHNGLRTGRCPSCGEFVVDLDLNAQACTTCLRRERGEQ